MNDVLQDPMVHIDRETGEALFQWKGQGRVGWKCPECGLVRQKDRHDPCLGELPGIKFACCGHGKEGRYNGYLYFENGIHLTWTGKLIIKRDEDT